MKKKKKILLFAIMFSLLIPSAAFAATYSYSGISLPGFSGSWVSPDRTKSTGDRNFSHRVSSLGGDFAFVNVYENIEIYGQVTPMTKHHEGDSMQNVYWWNSVPSNLNYSGWRANIVVSNANFTYVKVEAAGQYDLK